MPAITDLPSPHSSYNGKEEDHCLTFEDRQTCVKIIYADFLNRRTRDWSESVEFYAAFSNVPDGRCEGLALLHHNEYTITVLFVQKNIQTSDAVTVPR